MTTDRVGKLLERVAEELGLECDGCNCSVRKHRDVLEERLLPLLRAGQAMRDYHDEGIPSEHWLSAEQWDEAMAALATLEGRE